jgi:hypothetical protein
VDVVEDGAEFVVVIIDGQDPVAPDSRHGR